MQSAANICKCRINNQEGAIRSKTDLDAGSLVILDTHIVNLKEFCMRITSRIMSGRDKSPTTAGEMSTVASNAAWSNGGLKRLNSVLCQSILFGTDIFNRIIRTGRSLDDVEQALNGEDGNIATIIHCFPAVLDDRIL